ncbi:response regulator transcription factor [Paenibacillus planticolens]|uniref:Response regulator n=1 Tax=Paenibacillus planticolens TaxID=2654976 RepID=A0ABX1ZWC1_9BACL|nr:response regulator [Paenibacillus planticolens]NOV04351.1 response regulator [Paenibacillus planticolens]
MNIIIADDERLIRSSLSSMLDELEIQVHVVGEAKNGEELVELVERLAPDLVFVDIRMPKLTGLDAIKKVKDTAPSTQWVILSGFADFEYAREALQLGVQDYLLKPVTPEELHSCVSKMYRVFKDDIAAANRVFEHEVILFVNGSRSVHDFNDDPNFKYLGYIFYFDSYLTEKEKVHIRTQFMNRMQDQLDGLLSSRTIRFSLATLQNGNFAIIITWNTDPHSDGEKVKTEMENEIEQTVNLFSNDTFLTTAFKTGSCSDLQQIIEQFRTLDKLSMLRSIVTNRVVPLSGLNHLEKQSGLLNVANHLETMYKFIQEKDFFNYSKEHTLFKKALSEKDVQTSTISAVSNYFNVSINFTMPPGSSQNEWLAALISHVENMLRESPGEERLQGDWIQQVIHYVNENYMKEISIGQIAGEFHVTPNYLSSLFHKKHGTTFVKFLTETRMLKAKELLLKNPMMKVQQVAEEVGYLSTRHFTKLFVEYFGCYPSEVNKKK